MSELPRGTVTLLFSDIEGSTRLLQRMGDAYADLLDVHRRLLGEAFARHRGFVVDNEGDAFFVAFESANDAVAAAADAQLALARHVLLRGKGAPDAQALQPVRHGRRARDPGDRARRSTGGDNRARRLCDHDPG